MLGYLEQLDWETKESGMKAHLCFSELPHSLITLSPEHQPLVDSLPILSINQSINQPVNYLLASFCLKKKEERREKEYRKEEMADFCCEAQVNGVCQWSDGQIVLPNHTSSVTKINWK